MLDGSAALSRSDACNKIRSGFEELRRLTTNKGRRHPQSGKPARQWRWLASIVAAYDQSQVSISFSAAVTPESE